MRVISIVKFCQLDHPKYRQEVGINIGA